MTYSKTMATAWERCDQFNRKHDLGTRVMYCPTLCGARTAVRETVTRSVAWVMANGEAVVEIEGSMGGVSLDALEVIPTTVKAK